MAAEGASTPSRAEDPDAVTDADWAACRPGSEGRLLTWREFQGIVAEGRCWKKGNLTFVNNVPARTTPPITKEEYLGTLPDGEVLIPALRMFNRPTTPGWRIVVAGGAAAHPLFKAAGSDETPSDIDVFLVAPPEASERELWNALNIFMTNVVSNYHDRLTEMSRSRRPWDDGYSVEYSQRLTHGLCSVNIARWFAPLVETKEVQFILRRYPDLGSLLHAFDISSGAIATDGTDVWMTRGCALAHATGICPVDFRRRSLSFETRLAKYWQRGHGYVFAGAPWTLALGTNRLGEDGDLEVHVAATRGTTQAVVSSMVSKHPTSDYVTSTTSIRRGEWGPGDTGDDARKRRVDKATCENAKGGYSGLHALASWQSASGCAPTVPTVVTSSCDTSDGDGDGMGVAFHRYDPETLGFGTLYPLAALEKDIERFTAARGQPPTARALVNLLGMSAEDALEYVGAYERALMTRQKHRIDWWTGLAPRAAALKEKHRLACGAERPHWWITQDPGRQWTASRHPTPTDARTWLGAAALEPEGGRAETSATICSICLDPVRPGESGTVTLPCGHLYHFYLPNGRCGGVATIMRRAGADGAICPMCRAPLLTPDAAPPKDNGYTIVLSLPSGGGAAGGAGGTGGA